MSSALTAYMMAIGIFSEVGLHRKIESLETAEEMLYRLFNGIR